MTVAEWYGKGKDLLSEAGISEASLDAGLLLEAFCGIDRAQLFAHGEKELTQEEAFLYKEALEKRRKRIPLQHITGVQNFMGLDFSVTPDVLVPRADTEILTEEVLRDMHDGMRILDLCTGSGCILISLLRYNNWCEGVGVDLSEKALTVAGQNKEKLLEPEKSCVFLQGDLFEPVEGKFDVIVSNPPYIPTAVLENLMPEVRDHEPRMALDGREDGLFFYREIVKKAPEYLCRGGKLFFEIGYDQAAAVKEIMEKRGFREVTVVPDFSGLDRVVHGIWF